MDSRLVLILGGARSGKSAHAEKLARELGGKDVLYVATAEARDHEMLERIRAHHAARPPGWRTLEAPLGAGQRAAAELARASAGDPEPRVVILDCLTLLATNALLGLGEEAPREKADGAVRSEIDGILEAIRRTTATWIVVSNEVGLGIVPVYPLGRAFRDALGRANQRLAAAADQVLLMVAGIPMRIK
jgi:adenosylcobinamide kinase/adenosylcobinamide-phosphate guanylyltransferase